MLLMEEKKTLEIENVKLKAMVERPDKPNR